MTKQLLENLQASLGLDLVAFLPELVLCATIVLLLLIRLFPRFDRRHLGWVALVLTLYSLFLSWKQWHHVEGYDPRRGADLAQPLNIFSGLLVFDNFSIFLKLFLLGFTALVILFLWLFLEKTNVGLIIRGGTRNSEMVRLLGIDISKVWLMVFGIGTGLAGLAGILAAPMRGVYPEMGIAMLVECFVVTVVGGMGSLKGAVVSGLLLGQVVSMTSLFIPEASNIVIFIAMAVVLLIKPSGLFGISGLLE